MITATATFSPTVSADQVTSRNLFWTVNGVAAPALTVDASATTATFPVNPGDLVLFDVSDANVVGTSALSNVLTGTAPTAVPTAVPTTPVALTLTFANQATRKK